MIWILKFSLKEINTNPNQLFQLLEQNGANLPVNAQLQQRRNQIDTMRKASEANNAALANRKAGFILNFCTISDEYDQVQNEVLVNHLNQWKIGKSIF